MEYIVKEGEMKRKLFFMVPALMLIAVIAMSGTSEKKKETMEEPEMKEITLTWSSIAVPDAAHSKAMEKFKFELGRLSDNRITADLYFAGQIFTQEGELAAAREGTLDMAYYAPGWVAEFVPYLGQLGAVYTFSSYEHMRNVYSDPGIWGRIVEDVSENVGVRPLAAFYLGTRQLNVVEKVGPVRHPDDMEGVKLRTPNSPTWIALGRALGGDPTPMSFGEVYMGLKTGVIEGQDNPINTDRSQKFYEPTKYIIMTDHVVDTVWPSMNLERWNSLTEEDRNIVMEAIKIAREYNDELVRSREQEDRKFLEEQGIVFIDDPVKDAFIEYAKWSYQNESPKVSEQWDWGFYEQIQALKP
jgi:tripartite ATP-independent transporter DctP family solute receptor